MNGMSQSKNSRSDDEVVLLTVEWCDQSKNFPSEILSSHNGKKGLGKIDSKNTTPYLTTWISVSSGKTIKVRS